MNDREIFEELFLVAQTSQDPRGVVSSCLVRDGQIIAHAASSDDGDEHAENVLLNHYEGSPDGVILYCTLEPCSHRIRTRFVDCVSAIAGAGITHVIYGASDPGQSELTKRRCKEAGITLTKIDDPDIVERCARLFNDTVDPQFSEQEAPRKPLV